MRWLNNIWFRVRAIVFSGRMERDLDDEMVFHRRMEAEKLVAQGMAQDMEEFRRARAWQGSAACPCDGVPA